MKKIILFFFLLTFSAISFSQTPNWLWAKSAAGTNNDVGNSATVDAGGNVVVTGYFNSATITFGTVTLTNAGGTCTGGCSDIFIVKYDGSGNVLWAKSMGGTGNDIGKSVTTDLNGNIIVNGIFYSPTIIFGTDTLTNAGSNFADIFIVKYDSAGNILYVRSTGQFYNDIATSICTDGYGNVLVMGYFSNSTITFGTTTLNNVGDADIFLVKYDGSGNVLWAKSAGGTNFDYGMSVCTDSCGNILATGSFLSSTITFDTTTLISAYNTGGGRDIFVVKYDSSGNVLWAKGPGGASGDWGESVSVDAGGNVLVTGYFNSPTLTFDTTTLTTLVNSNIFIVKYDSSGNVLWAKGAGGTNPVSAGYGVSTDANGNVFVTGRFYSPSISFGTITLNNVTNTGISDIFIVKYDGSGNVLWAKSSGGISGDYGLSIAISASGNAFITGTFNSPTISFGTTTLINAGGSEVYTSKLDNYTGIEDASASFSITTISPNPAADELIIENGELKIKEIEIYNTVGEKVFEKRPTSNVQHLTISVADFPPGIYFITVTDQAGNKVTKKVVKM